VVFFWWVGRWWCLELFGDGEVTGSLPVEVFLAGAGHFFGERGGLSELANGVARQSAGHEDAGPRLRASFRNASQKKFLRSATISRPATTTRPCLPNDVVDGCATGRDTCAMSCSLGVNSFRSGAQIVVRQLSKPCGRLRLGAAPTSRCFSIWLPQTRNQRYSTGRREQNFASHPSRRLPSLRAGARTFKVRNVLITSYIDLPPDYKDEDGLPFRSTELGADEIARIFGPYMKTSMGNRLLRILHGRRVAGTLNDPTVEIHTAMYSKEQKRAALEYLRRLATVDEVLNAGLRAEEELAKLEGGLQDESDIKGVTVRKPSEKSGNVYGRGVFDVIREQNEAKFLAEEEAKRLLKEEKRKKEEEQMAKMSPKELEAYVEGKKGLTGRKPSANMQAYMEAAQSKLEAPPEMSKWERIGPSAVVVFLVSGLLIAYAAYYRPLKRSDRLLPDIPPAAATVGAIILANIGVYALWKVPRLWPMLNKYFLVIPATPRALSIYGATVSHQLFSHLVVNMGALWMVGTAYYDEVGRGDFLATYFTSGAMGFLGTLTWTVLRNQLHLTSLGASGGVYGLVGAYFWMHRSEGFKLLGLPPDPYNGVPGLAFIGTIIGLNIAAMFSRNAGWDVASHMVGMAVGIAAGHLMEKKKEAKRLAQEKPSGETKMGVVIPAETVEEK
jgi:rhomboid-like protein